MPELSYLPLPDGPTHIADFGGEGENVLLLHGLGGSHVNWLAVGDQLRKLGRVVAVDLPGFGFTPPRRGYSLEIHRRTVEQVCDHLGSPALLVGNSMGGLVAELQAAARPEQTRALVLVSPAGPPPPGPNRVDPAIAARLFIQALPGLGPAYIRRWTDRRSPDQQVWHTLGMVCANRSAVPDYLIAASTKMAVARRQMPWSVEALSASGRAIGIFIARRQRFTELIRSITAPALIIQGVSDKVVTTDSVRWLASLRPDWRHIEMEGTAHCPQFDAGPRFVREVLSWAADQVATKG